MAPVMDHGIRLNHLTQQHHAHQSLLSRLEGQEEALRGQLSAAQHNISELNEEMDALALVANYLSTFGEDAQRQVQARIEHLVSHALVSIFGDNMTFQLVPGTRGNQATLAFQVTSTMGAETVATPIMDARGGGVASVVGFVLRLVVLLLTPGASHLMVLDESFAQVSAEYEGRLAEFLSELTQRTDVQIILITHSEAYTDLADKAYRFRLQDGQTKVEDLSGSVG